MLTNKTGWAKGIVTACLCAGLAACGGGGGGTTTDAVAAGTTLSSSIASAQTGIVYDLDIWLPASYSSGAAAYPVVYATDCEYRFATLKAALQDTHTEAILVNVCAMGTARRLVDFTMPGAAAYYRFLTLELIPSIESKYRTVPSRRILSGHSLSGAFAMYALYLEKPGQRYFASIISADCACWSDASGAFSRTLPLPIAMEQAMYDADHSLPVDLVMAGDSSFNQPNVAAVYDVIASQHFQGLRSIQPVYSLGHIPMDGPSFKDALAFIFNGR